MSEAYKLAQEALEHGDVPVGAVVVRGGKIIGRGENRRQKTGDPSAHAGDHRDERSFKAHRQLEPFGLLAVCDAGALPHVRRRRHSVAHG